MSRLARCRCEPAERYDAGIGRTGQRSGRHDGDGVVTRFDGDRVTRTDRLVGHPHLDRVTPRIASHCCFTDDRAERPCGQPGSRGGDEPSEALVSSECDSEGASRRRDHVDELRAPTVVGAPHRDARLERTDVHDDLPAAPRARGDEGVGRARRYRSTPQRDRRSGRVNRTTTTSWTSSIRCRTTSWTSSIRCRTTSSSSTSCSTKSRCRSLTTTRPRRSTNPTTSSPSGCRS